MEIEPMRKKIKVEEVASSAPETCSSAVVKHEEEEPENVGSAQVSNDNKSESKNADDGSDNEEVPLPAKQKNDSGETFFKLSKNRRVTIRKYKKSTLVDIREYYEKGEQQLPGKKGISLTLDQFRSLKALMEAGSIDKAIKKL